MEPKPSKSPASEIVEANLVSVELLVTDAKLAMTFLDLADSTDIPEDRQRRIGEAHRAYTTILAFLPRLTPTAEQTEILNSRMDSLERRLRAAGVVLD